VDAVGAAVSGRELIAVRRLTKRFGTGAAPVIALSNIDFSIAERELVAVVGPSGCGKSTLLRILAGLLPPTDGEAWLDGARIEGPRRDIGVVFQSPVLFPWRSVLGNVLLPVDVQHLGRVQLRSRAIELLRLVGLEGFKHRFPWELSGGMQQTTAVHDDMRVLSARMDSWRLETGGVKRWGESNVDNFDRYIDFLVKWKIVPQKVPASELVTNDLIDDINSFDAGKIEAMAKSYKP
jgi:predicted ABC-type transport system involved in lysophospholipase L1 biosynthesis ATPase subunit